MTRSPAFQFYPNDFLSDAKTMVMSTEEIGAYLLLLCACWKEDGLDQDIKKLSRIARLREKKFLTLWENSISVCFYLDRETGKYRQKRLDKELKKQQDKSVKNRENALERWEQERCERNANAMQNDALHISSSFSSSTSVKDSAKAGDMAAADTSRNGDKAQRTNGPVERRIWTDGVELLSTNGVKDPRPLLGRLAKEYGKTLLAECIAATQAENPADPKAFLIKTLKTRKAPAWRDVGKGDDDDTPCSHCGATRRVVIDGIRRACPDCRPEDYKWQVENYPNGNPAATNADRS
jgi:uncharacterized protein YdaU (DUF1376 family)